eukprot:TRINITY_DN5139_c0_g1_i1.p1 TRINITY_DN5139_c0_g1~~TRINITY_DN5139_c0_g1_i1.p1  ORF type:complete len:348 (+),score=54.31 TRINITY_DN5139_c0_g1_i1:43-1044(+)
MAGLARWLALLVLLPGCAADLRYYATSTGGLERPYWEPGETMTLAFIGTDFVDGAQRALRIYPPADDCNSPTGPLLHSTTTSTEIAQFNFTSITVNYNAPLTVCYESAAPGTFLTAQAEIGNPPPYLWAASDCTLLTSVDATVVGTTGIISDGSPEGSRHPRRQRTCEYQVRGPTGCQAYFVFDHMNLNNCAEPGGPVLLFDDDPQHNAAACAGRTVHIPKDNVNIKFQIGSNVELNTGTGFTMKWVFHCTQTMSRTASATATTLPTRTETRSPTKTAEGPCDDPLPKWICPEETVQQTSTEQCEEHPLCSKITACSEDFLAEKCLPLPNARP